MTRKQQLIWTLIPLGVILALGAGVLLVSRQFTPALSEPEPVQEMYLQDVSQEEGQPVFVVVNGPGQRVFSPLARYPVTPPEGYTQTTDSARTANEESERYTDCFLGRGKKVVLRQQAVANQDRVILPAAPQRVQFGELELLCYSGDTQSGAVWLFGDSLLRLEVTGRMEQEELLEWVSRVDLNNPAYPAFSSLTFLPGYCREIQGETGLLRDSSGWQVAGNPEPDPENRLFRFPETPEGFTPQEGEHLSRWTYQNRQGDRLSLTNRWIRGYTHCNIFNKIPEQDYANPALVRAVTVNGREGRLYCTGDYGELVLLGDDVAAQLIYEGEITPEEMLELGETLILE